VTPWLKEIGPIDGFNTSWHIWSQTRDLFGGFVCDPKNVDTTITSDWIGTFANQELLVRKHRHKMPRDEEPLRHAAKEIPVLVILGKEDKFLLPEKVKELCLETFGEELAEVQIWPGVGHLPFYEEPEKTRDAILGFTRKVLGDPPVDVPIPPYQSYGCTSQGKGYPHLASRT